MDCLTLQDEKDRLSRNVSYQLPIYTALRSLKREYLPYILAALYSYVRPERAADRIDDYFCADQLNRVIV